MIVAKRSADVKQIDLHNGQTVLHTKKRVLIGPEQGAPTFVMRLFTVEADGCSPYHTHPWEHEVFVLAGKGTVKSPDGEVQVSAGDCVYVPPNEEHQFLNAGADPFEFLCIVPKEGEG